ncbi:sulfatase-like hydrolase/transferase [Pontibacter sp. E15-1]|uniref:sulfatase-like hydrolase/transferase n=1 Tax=Pontibacter sp. E15-1 TaxID=2919918 RepID=UPI001F50320E|nr:sulfatase-like hydrolase/transferase [Pontibacter sp. E15-1]MCJ8164875.1 sulfatase-like hydrolase/transferase [Pontibacter sp. E15-1]
MSRKVSGSLAHKVVLRRRMLVYYAFLIAGVWGMMVSCSLPASKGKPALRTQNVIIVVIDGPRYSETWANTPGLIPNMSTDLKPEGSFLSTFLNDGYTYTNSGHAAITTGVNQPIDNYGDEYPANPSIFQYWLKASGKPKTAAWIISSKDKLHILANTQDSLWQNQFMPALNCGVNGPGTGYRADSLTLEAVKQVLTTHKPNLVLVNFMEPDGYAHAGNWDYYVRGISRDDRYIKELWDFISKDEFYRNKTTLLITNDHGRHLDSVDGGWQEHGDNCEGCQHISLLALGPDFNKNAVIETRHTLVDIAPTVAKLLRFEMDSTVVVPRLDTVAVAFAVDSLAVGTQKDSVRIVSQLDTTVLQGRVIRELFLEKYLR